MYTKLSQDALVKPTVVGAAATSTQTGTGVDCAGYDRACCVLHVASHDRGDADETLDVKVQDSADNSTFADVTGAAFTQITAAATATTGDVYLMDIALAKRKRYLRGVATPGGTTPIDSYTVNFVLFRGQVEAPTQDATAKSV